MSIAPLLNVQGLSIRTRSGKPIVEDISFEVASREVLGIFGDSGAGKTSILMALFGLHPKSFVVEGQITFQGQTITNLSTERRSHLGMSIVLQNLSLFPDRSVYENIAYPLRMRNVDKTQIKCRVLETLALLQIDDLAQRMPHQISGGQRQRVALARSIVFSPKLLLLDEPLRGLQDEMRLQFLAYVRSVVRDSCAVLFVTHQRDELELIADTIITIENHCLHAKESVRTNEDVFLSLRRFSLAPSPNGDHRSLRVTHADLISPDVKSQTENILDVKVIDVRRLLDGRYCMLVAFPDGQPGWLYVEQLTGRLSNVIGTQLRVRLNTLV